uniref:Uncharacterized protein n=1 Tax=Opuntia streptacantha TaxID=393608 RepID=A0A7C9DMN8_OPUST
MTCINPKQNLDDPSFNFPNRHPGTPLGLFNHRSQIRPEILKHKHSILIFTPKVLVQNDDVGAVLEGLEGLDFAKSALVVVDFFEGNWEAVGSPESSVDVGISAGADALFDVVF